MEADRIVWSSLFGAMVLAWVLYMIWWGMEEPEIAEPGDRAVMIRYEMEKKMEALERW